MYKQCQNRLQWSKFHCPWKEVIKKENIRHCSSTNILQFGNFSYFHEQKNNNFVQFIKRKNAQLSNDYITCLLCSKPGHLCHKCKYYVSKIQQLNSDESSTVSISSRIEDSNEINKNDATKDKVMTNCESNKELVPIFLVKKPIKKLTFSMFKNKNDRVNNKTSILNTRDNSINIYQLKEPILFKKESIFNNESTYKTYLVEKTNFDPQLTNEIAPNEQEALKACNDNKIELQVDFNCENLKHSTNQYVEDWFSKYFDEDKIVKSCKVVQLCAQMSFRIRGRPQFNPNFHSKLSEYDHCESNQTTSNVVNQIENISDIDEEVVKNTNYQKLNHKIQEVDYEQLLNSKSKDLKSKDLKPIINLWEYEQSVAVVLGKINGYECTMLLDTGSSISAITEDFVQQLNLESWYTNDILVVTLANTCVEKYRERKCVVTLEIGDLKCWEEFDILPGQIYNVTLGKNWLKGHMAICDYGLDILRLPNSRPIRMGFPPATRLKSAMKKIS